MRTVGLIGRSLWWLGALALIVVAGEGLDRLSWFHAVPEGAAQPIRWGMTGLILAVAGLLRPWRRQPRGSDATDPASAGSVVSGGDGWS